MIVIVFLDRRSSTTLSVRMSLCLYVCHKVRVYRTVQKSIIFNFLDPIAECSVIVEREGGGRAKVNIDPCLWHGAFSLWWAVVRVLFMDRGRRRFAGRDEWIPVHRGFKGGGSRDFPTFALNRAATSCVLRLCEDILIEKMILMHGMKICPISCILFYKRKKY